MTTLPVSRDITCGVGPVPPDLLNTLQDLFVGKCCPPMTKHTLPPDPGAIFWTRTTIGIFYIHSTAAGDCLIPLEVEEGDRITGMSLKLYGDGAVDVDYNVMVLADDMVTATSLSSTADVDRAAAWGTLVMPAFVPHVMAAGECLLLYANANAANARIGRISRTYDRLL